MSAYKGLTISWSKELVRLKSWRPHCFPTRREQSRKKLFLRQVLHDDEIYPDFTILPGRRALEYVSNLSLLWDDSQDLLQTKNEKNMVGTARAWPGFFNRGSLISALPSVRSAIFFGALSQARNNRTQIASIHDWNSSWKVQIQLNKGIPMNARFLRFHLRNNCNPAFSAKIALVCFFIRKLRSFNSKEFIIKLTRWLVTDRRELRLSLHK